MKLIYPGIALITMGAVGIIFSIVMELITGEPMWMVLIKITACFFGVGGGLLGLGGIIIRRRGGRQ